MHECQVKKECRVVQERSRTVCWTILTEVPELTSPPWLLRRPPSVPHAHFGPLRFSTVSVRNLKANMKGQQPLQTKRKISQMLFIVKEPRLKRKAQRSPRSLNQCQKHRTNRRVAQPHLFFFNIFEKEYNLMRVGFFSHQLKKIYKNG